MDERMDATMSDMDLVPLLIQVLYFPFNHDMRKMTPLTLTVNPYGFTLAGILGP